LRLVENKQLLATNVFVPIEIEPQSLRLEFQVELGPAQGAGQRRLRDLTRTEESCGGLIFQGRSELPLDASFEHKLEYRELIPVLSEHEKLASLRLERDRQPAQRGGGAISEGPHLKPLNSFAFSNAAAGIGRIENRPSSICFC
jgi:hypothetical protein